MSFENFSIISQANMILEIMIKAESKNREKSMWDRLLSISMYIASLIFYFVSMPRIFPRDPRALPTYRRMAEVIAKDGVMPVEDRSAASKQ